MSKIVVLVLILATQFAVCAQASGGLAKTWKGPDMTLLRKIIAEAPPASAPATKTSAIKFTPTRSSGVSQLLADVFGRNADEKAALAEAFDQIKEGYTAEASKEGKANDLAAAMAFFLAANVSAFHRTDMPSDADGEKLYHSLASSMSSNTAVTSMSNADKERMHDWLVCMAGFVATGYEDAKTSGDKTAMATIAELAKASMKLVLGLDIEKMSIGPGGVKTEPSAPSATPPSSAAARNLSGITKGTTTAGGWTARVDADFVSLTNGRIDVHLFYPFQLTDAQRGDYDLADHCWNTIVVPRFNITSAEKFKDSVPDVTNWLYYYEGTGSLKGSGKQSFIAMKADSAQGGIVTVIVVVAADKQTYKQTFPDPKGLSHLKAANRFAITSGDLVGTWNESAGFGLSFVSSNTGNFAGMTTAANNNEFAFAGDGSYRSKHAEASTSFGGMRGSKTEYNGKFSVTDWELTLNGTAGRIVYTAYFEAVKNGRILHLAQQNASGNSFTLGLVR